MRYKTFLYILAGLANVGIELAIFCWLYGSTNKDVLEIVAVTFMLSMFLMLPIYIKVEEVGKKNEAARKMLERSNNRRSSDERF